MRAIDPSAPYGPWHVVTTGTVVIGGGAVGGAGGTSMVDNNPFTPGGTSITPAGGYVGGRQVASGNAGAFAMSASAIMQVHVVAGGAGGGVANITVHGTAGNDVNVGFASGAAGAAGNWAMPVVYASGVYPTVNVGVLPGVVGSVRTTNLGGSVGVIGAGGSMGVVGLGGSVGVTQIGAPWSFTGSAAVTPAADFTVWLANSAGGGFASVAVYGSPANPVYNIGTVHVSNFSAGTGFASVAVYGSPAMPVYALGTVHVSNFAAGTGFASVAVYGSPGMPIYNIGTVHVSNFSAGTGFASVAVYGSPAMPVYVIGSSNVVGGGGSMGVVQITSPWIVTGSQNVTALGGSVGVVQITSPWVISGNVGVFGSVTGIQTVNMGNIPTVNLGMGTVNIGNNVTVVGSVFATPLGIQITDTRGSLVPTQWPFSFGGSGYFAIANAPGANLRVYVYAAHVSTAATVRTFMSFQSPSGTFLTGSLPLPPGAGWNMGPGVLGNALFAGGVNGTFYIQASGTENMAGFLSGWVGA